jgi:hypothetical protein
MNQHDLPVCAQACHLGFIAKPTTQFTSLILGVHLHRYRCSELVHDGANVERFLVGRQFLLLFSGFLVTRIGGAKTESFYIGDWEWSSEASQVFWVNSLLLTIVIIVPGQLVTQLVASDKMLGFLNLPFAPFWTVVMPCLAIESIGLLHSTYLLKDILCWAFSVDLGQRDPVKVMDKNALYYIRVGISSIILTFAGVFVIKGIFGLQTNISQGAGWDLLPGWGAFLITCVLILIMAGAEGLQVSALVLVTAQTSEIKASSPLAYRTCQLLYTGRNLQAFLVGRQFMVAIMIVLLSRATTYSGEHGTLVTGSDWGMGSQFAEVLLQSGFLGAVFVSTVAQLVTQVTASIYPASFINNRVLNVLLRIMLMFELSGIVNSCWPLAWAFNAIARLEKDPFKSLAENALDRKESMGVPMKVRSESDLHQREFVNHEKVFKVSLV